VDHAGDLIPRMARKLRVQYPGAIHHVMNRGERREAIFLDDRDGELFLETLGEACEKTDWQVPAWCLGSEEFGQGLLAQVSVLAGPEHRGEDILQSAQQKAERIVREELERLGWGAEDLAGRPKGDARKVRIAARLRRETTMTLAWIGGRLGMGAPDHVSRLLYRKHNNQRQLEDENSENKWF
jgi:hypothetical protein